MQYVPSRSSIAIASITAAAFGCGDDHPTQQPDATATVDAVLPPPPPSVTFFDYAIAVDVSPDGRIAMFEDLSTAEARAIPVDTITGTVGKPIDVGDPSLDIATGVANDGRLSAIRGNPAYASVYDPATMTWHDLTSPYATSCDPNVSGAFDIGGDGSAAVGLLWNACVPVAFRADAGVVTPLQILGAHTGGGAATNRASVISDDGKVVAGFAENQQLDRSAAIWQANGQGALIDAVQQDAPSEFLSIDADGGVLAGVFGYDAFVWTAADGATPIPRPDAALPSDPQFPNAMTADGRVVFGGVGDAFSGIPIAFAWSKADGVRQLVDIATAAGITFPTGTLFNSVLGVSGDGTVLVGTAMDMAGVPKTFLMRLPASAIH